jgi:hypothetical protein
LSYRVGPQREKANKIENDIKEQLARLFAEQRGPAAARQAYQVHASRTATDGFPAFVNGTVTFDDPKNRVIGPVLILAKTTLADPITDSFDGELNGLLDVAEAREVWRLSDVNAANNVFTDGRVSVAEGLDRFTNKLRARATVNGGSIGLRALVVSGTNAAGQFQRFDSDRILITPCFPVVQELGYNVEVYAGPVVSTVANRTASLLKSVQVPLSSFLDGTAFRPTVGPFDLTRLTRSARAGEDTIDAVEGRFSFELCSQFSYFN